VPVATPVIGQFVLKVHGRCNLACDYCYVYESVDQSWRSKPLSMSPDTARATGRRIREHALAHELPRVGITLHGGEPLLLGHNGLAALVGQLRAGMGEGIGLDLGLQTNGVLFDESFAEYCLREGICVGVSLDGGRTANDRHRRFAHGGSSFDTVVGAVRLLTSPAYRRVFSGVLVTVDPFNDPRQVFTDMLVVGPGRIDLLLPHATWDNPPPAACEGDTVYGDWLIDFFDAWYDAAPQLGVRLFEEIMNALLGGPSTTEAIGLSAQASLVIETDGSYERSDILKVTYQGAPDTGYDVRHHRVDEVLQDAGVRALMRGSAALSRTCQECTIVAACGGGLYPHRYRAENGFDNPSVYCRDLGHFIGHVSERVTADLARRASRGSAPAGPCHQRH
jgi:uncharacterized protein